MKLTGEYWNAITNNNIVAARNHGVVMIHWSPPKLLYVKLNTDEAFKDKQIAACGGVIRGNQGLRYDYRLGFKKIELNIDSEVVVRVLKNGTSNSAMGSSLLKHIKNLLALDWMVEISHSYREANKRADARANIGCSNSYDTVFYDWCPELIRNLYDADIQGSSTPRL
ncbi:hypothetical protein TSUD_373190 [Trifolium subterraneum]|uniref:RNase H type-1 domain-containing protein n=1 Tax=Trifolium subterraneum TaxID=3900 RepID=A0A2Z6P6Z4_TRISU|nr:hypothetical protein TSUD_373190 [Trifolium subterraneum]